MDLLELKLQSRHQVKAWFPEYHGNNAKNGTMLEYNDLPLTFLLLWVEVVQFFQAKFIKIFRGYESSARTRQIYIHATTATCTEMIQTILSACKDVILRDNLRESGLV